jgi:uncharacterized protein (DUF2062 family)
MLPFTSNVFVRPAGRAVLFPLGTLIVGVAVVSASVFAISVGIDSAEFQAYSGYFFAAATIGMVAMFAGLKGFVYFMPSCRFLYRIAWVKRGASLRGIREVLGGESNGGIQRGPS